MLIQAPRRRIFPESPLWSLYGVHSVLLHHLVLFERGELDDEDKVKRARMCAQITLSFFINTFGYCLQRGQELKSLVKIFETAENLPEALEGGLWLIKDFAEGKLPVEKAHLLMHFLRRVGVAARHAHDKRQHNRYGRPY